MTIQSKLEYDIIFLKTKKIKEFSTRTMHVNDRFTLHHINIYFFFNQKLSQMYKNHTLSTRVGQTMDYKLCIFKVKFR